jgi:hypothetical protein
VAEEPKSGFISKVGGFLKGFFEEDDDSFMDEEDMELKALEDRLMLDMEKESDTPSKSTPPKSTSLPKQVSATKSERPKTVKSLDEPKLQNDKMPNLELFDTRSLEEKAEKPAAAAQSNNISNSTSIEKTQQNPEKIELPKIEKKPVSIEDMDKAKSLSTMSSDEMFGTSKNNEIESADTVLDYWRKNKRLFGNPFTNKDQGIDDLNNVIKIDTPQEDEDNNQPVAPSVQPFTTTREIVSSPEKELQGIDTSAAKEVSKTKELTQDLLEDEFFKQAIEARNKQKAEMMKIQPTTAPETKLVGPVEVQSEQGSKQPAKQEKVQESLPAQVNNGREEARKLSIKDTSSAPTAESNLKDVSEPITTGSDIDVIFDSTPPLTVGNHEIKGPVNTKAEKEVEIENLDDAPNETLLSSDASAQAKGLTVDADYEEETPDDLDTIEDGAYSLYADEVLPTYLEGTKVRGKYSYEQDVTDNPVYRKKYDEGNKHLPPVMDVVDYTKNLFYATYENNVEAVRSLVERGADINAQDENTGYTPAMLALISGKKDAFAYLMNIGANANILDNNGNSMLQHALMRQDLDSYKLILKIAPRIPKSVIRQSMEMVVENGYSQEWALPLIEFMGGANEMLINFAQLNDFYGVSLALNAGADLNTVSSQGLSVFEYAVINQNIIMLEELYEADPQSFMAIHEKLRSMAYRSYNSQFKVAFENLLLAIEMQN